MSLNKVMLIGRLGKDPETRFTANGYAVCKISLATDEKKKDETVTEWHTVKFFGKTAEIVDRFCKKGRQIYVEGSIHYSTYEKDGETKYFTEILGYSVQFLGGGKSDAEKQQDEEEKPKKPQKVEEKEDLEDDIPF